VRQFTPGRVAIVFGQLSCAEWLHRSCNSASSLAHPSRQSIFQLHRPGLFVMAGLVPAMTCTARRAAMTIQPNCKQRLDDNVADALGYILRIHFKGAPAGNTDRLGLLKKIRNFRIRPENWNNLSADL
jgi:hypothetical protein